MTDDLTRFRELMGEATPGRWGVGQSVAGPVWIFSDQPEALKSVATVEITPREQADATAIVTAIRLARFITSEGTEERLARIIDPKQWRDFDAETSNPPKRWANKDALDWKEYYRRACNPSLKAARAILTTLARAALGEEGTT